MNSAKVLKDRQCIIVSMFIL
uniref:Uncharacterized protein n=1 Tax=Anguilla anguilla TaxID=7936 RepID=A0A0E9S3P7_ANGAN